MKTWKEKELTIMDLKKIESLKFCETHTSWIEYYHHGVPAFRIEKAFIANSWEQSPVDLLKFNIFCFSTKTLIDIIPTGYRIPDANDWDKIKLNQKNIEKIFPQKYNEQHHSFLFFSNNDILSSSSDFLENKPHKYFFERNLERTIVFQFNNIILNSCNQLELRRIIDFADYPKFMMKFIK
jgi:hypothetical protein